MKYLIKEIQRLAQKTLDALEQNELEAKKKNVLDLEVELKKGNILTSNGMEMWHTYTHDYGGTDWICFRDTSAKSANIERYNCSNWGILKALNNTKWEVSGSIYE